MYQYTDIWNAKDAAAHNLSIFGFNYGFATRQGTKTEDNPARKAS